MRAVLVDWMVEMQESFELNHETLYTSIKIMDHYLDKCGKQIRREDLQLMGSTAIFIASKFEVGISLANLGLYLIYWVFMLVHFPGKMSSTD